MSAPVSYEEYYQGRAFDFTAQKIEVPFVVTGCFAELSAFNVVAAASATRRSGLWRQNIAANDQGNGCWKGTVTYGQEQKAVGTYNMTFDTTGGTLHVAVSKSLRAKYSIYNAAGVVLAPYTVGSAAPIGEHDGQVDGCEIVIPALKLTWTFRHAVGAVPMSRIKQLARFTGYTNTDQWMTFDANELLFLGATGSQGSDTETTVAYNFAASENITGLTIGDIAGIAKKGHDYLDVKWMDTVETHGSYELDAKKAKHVYTHRVYDETAFGTLMGF
jgi:hypothetical protein